METSVLGLLAVLEALRPAMTRPTWGNFLTLAVGWLLSPGRRAVTVALQAAGVAGIRHHAAYHRFFSQARWSTDAVGRLIFQQILRFLPEDAPIPIAIDDTLSHRKGPHVFGIGTHVDAVRSTKRHRVFTFGVCWVALTVNVRFPALSERPFALPVLLRLYRTKSTCPKEAYRKKTELARQMLDVLAGWAGGRRVEVATDSAYCNDTITRNLPGHLFVYSRMRPDAALTALPEPRAKGQKGRPPLRGKTLPKPEALAKDRTVPWREMEVTLYGHKRTVSYKTCKAQWYRACGTRLLTLVIVQVTTGNCQPLTFFCTDPEATPEQVLVRYASRWAIEVTFRHLKQELGFEHGQAWTPRAVERTAPFVAYLYSIVVLWFAEYGHQTHGYTLPSRPWYRHKQGVSFQDMLLTAQAVLLESGILDPACNFNNLRIGPPASADPAPSSLRAAA